MKEKESVFQRLRKEHEAVDTNTWERKVKSSDVSSGLKEIAWNLQGLPQRFVATLADVVGSMRVEHISVAVYARANHTYEVNMEPAKDEFTKKNLPGEAKYADRNVIQTRIQQNYSMIGVFSDTVTAGEDGDSMIDQLMGMLAELRKDDRMMKETTDAVMRVVLETIHGTDGENIPTDPNPLEDYIAGLDLDI